MIFWDSSTFLARLNRDFVVHRQWSQASRVNSPVEALCSGGDLAGISGRVEFVGVSLSSREISELCILKVGRDMLC